MNHMVDLLCASKRSIEALKVKGFSMRMDRDTLGLCLATGTLVAMLVWYISGLAVPPLLSLIYP